MVFPDIEFQQFRLRMDSVGFSITIATLLLNVNALTWSGWLDCPGTLCGKSRAASCRTNGVEDLGLKCVKEGEPFLEKLYDCSTICSRWTNERLIKPCSGICYVATEEYSANCQNKITCLKKDVRRCYNKNTCSGSWSSAGPISQCSATCGGGKQTQTEHCKRNTVLTTACVGSQGTQTSRIVTKDCNTNACPVWTKWSTSSCDSSCMMKRTRTCRYNNAESTGCGGSSSTQTETVECTAFVCATTTKSTTTKAKTQPPKTVKTTTSRPIIILTPKTSTKTASTTTKTSSTKKTTTLILKPLRSVPCVVGMKCNSWTDWAILRECNASCTSGASGLVLKTRTCMEKLSECNQIVETQFESCEQNLSCMIGTGGVSTYLIVIIILVVLFIIFIIAILYYKRRNQRRKRMLRPNVELVHQRSHVTFEHSDLLPRESQRTAKPIDEEENVYEVMIMQPSANSTT